MTTAPQNALKLFYFPFRGRGEQIRLLFAAAGVKYEDVRVLPEEFSRLKAEGRLPFGALPVIEDDGFVLAQSGAIMLYLGEKFDLCPQVSDSKARSWSQMLTAGAEDLRIKYFNAYAGRERQTEAFISFKSNYSAELAKFEGILRYNNGGQSGYFIGNDLTYADLAVWDVIDATMTYLGAELLAEEVVRAYPLLSAFMKRVAERPGISAYLKARK